MNLDPTSGPTDRKSQPAMLTVAILLLYFTATLALYWPVLLKHYVGDDWLFLHALWSQGSQAFLASSWDPAGTTLYRPLVKTLLVAVYHVFGLSALPVNVAVLACHTTNGFLLSLVCRKLGSTNEGGVLAGFLFVCLAALHIDPLLWFVGFFDVGLVTFSLIAVASFIDNRSALVVLFTSLALLTKEAAVYLVPLFVIWGLFLRRPQKLNVTLLLVFGGYVALKLRGTSPFALGPSNAHAMSFSLSHALILLKTYSAWILSSFVPVLPLAVSTVVAVGLSIAVSLFWVPNRRRLAAPVPLARVAVLAGWTFLALLPVLFLRNQSARYYAMHAAVPVCLFIGIVLSETLVTLPARRRRWIFVLTGVLVFAANLFFTRHLVSEGIRQRIRDDGWFHLVKRSAAVDSVYVHLFDRYPAIPRGSRIHIANVPLDAIGNNAAVQVWYRDSTLSVDAGADTSDFSMVSPDAVSVSISPPADSPSR